MAYVYRHIRLDKNETFYIGIGSDDKGKHRRAHYFICRSDLWNNIYKKTKIQVEIIHDDIDIEEAKRLEIYYIALFKRRQDGGTLVNHTLGGEGAVGVRHPELVQRNKTRPWLGKRHSIKTRRLMSKTRAVTYCGARNPNYKGPIYAYIGNRLITKYIRVQEIAKITKLKPSTVSTYIAKKQKIKGIFYTRRSL